MPTFSIEERKALVTKFEARTISCDAFCKVHNISAPTIYKWRKDLERCVSEASSINRDDYFIPLEIVYSESSPPILKPSALSTISSSFKLYNAGLTIEFCSGCSLSELSAVIGIFGGNDVTK